MLPKAMAEIATPCGYACNERSSIFLVRLIPESLGFQREDMLTARRSGLRVRAKAGSTAGECPGRRPFPQVVTRRL